MNKIKRTAAQKKALLHKSKKKRDEIKGGEKANEKLRRKRRAKK